MPLLCHSMTFCWDYQTLFSYLTQTDFIHPQFHAVLNFKKPPIFRANESLHNGSLPLQNKNNGRTNRQFSMDEDEPMQTDPIYLSSKEDTMSKYAMSDDYSAEDNNTQIQTLSQFLEHPNDPTDDAQVTISGYNVEMTHLFSTATINSEPPLSKQTHKVSPASPSYSA